MMVCAKAHQFQSAGTVLYDFHAVTYTHYTCCFSTFSQLSSLEKKFLKCSRVTWQTRFPVPCCKLQRSRLKHPSFLTPLGCTLRVVPLFIDVSFQTSTSLGVCGWWWWRGGQWLYWSRLPAALIGLHRADLHNPTSLS